MQQIISWVKKTCDKWNLRAIYVPHVGKEGGLQNDFFSLTTPQGHVVLNFTTRVFFDIPPRLRDRNMYPTIKRGLMNLVGEKQMKRDQRTIIPRRYGKRIV